MRKYRWPIILGSAAALFAVLFFGNKWMIAKGRSLTFHMGANIEQPPFVQVNWPCKVDVVAHVSDRLKGENFYRWGMQTDFAFRNNFNKEIRIRLPLLRASLWNPSSTQFLFNAELAPEWKQHKTITLKPGESFTLSLAKDGRLTQNDLFARQESDRWALVFGAPDGEDPDKYLVGTVLSNPIEYRNEIPTKSEK
jgi:hypothetical protein